jgi:UDP-N-acetyl-D-glucosamine dehydrogenase
MDELDDRGAQVDYFDPHIPVITPTREHARWTGTRSIAWSAEAVASYDCVLIATNHKAFDLETLLKFASLIVDTRNAVARAGLTPREGQVVKA